MKKVWNEASTRYFVSLVDCPFADSHGGKCSNIGGWLADRDYAERQRDRLQQIRKDRGIPGRYIVESLEIPAGYSWQGTLKLDSTA